MDGALLMPREVDLILRYSAGRTLRLARAGKIPHVVLPDGEVRIQESDVKRLLDAGRVEAGGEQHG